MINCVVVLICYAFGYFQIEEDQTMEPHKQKKTKKGLSKKTEEESHEKDRSEALESEQANTEQPTATTDIAARKSGGKRGVCAMYKVIAKKSHGKKSKVTSNEWGIPCGETRARLQSYIGMLARTTIPIDIQTWPNVNSELKSKLWLEIQVLNKM